MYLLHLLSYVPAIAKRVLHATLMLIVGVLNILVVIVQWFVARPYFTLGLGIVLLVIWKARKTVVVFSPFHVPTKNEFPFTGETVTGCLLHTLAKIRKDARGENSNRGIRPYGEGRVDQYLFYLPPQATVFQSPPQFAVEVKGISYEGAIATMRKVLNTERILSGEILLQGESMTLLVHGQGIRPAETKAVPVTFEGLKQGCRELAQEILLDLDPDLLGVVLAREQKFGPALSAFQKSVQRSPKAPEAFRNLATAFAGLGRYDDAMANYEKSLALTKKQREVVLYAMGEVLIEGRHFDEALEKYEEALEVNPAYVRALNGKGIIFRRRKQLEAAKSIFDEIMALDPTFAPAYSNKGSILLEQRKLDESLLVYKQALKLLPNDPIVHTGMANVLSEKGDFAVAIEHYRAALRIRPNLASARMRLGKALESSGAPLDDALVQYRRAVQLEPKNGYFRVSLGDALKNKGTLNEAIPEFREAVHLRPRNAYFHTALGDALKESGNLDEAMTEYRAAIRVEPSSAYAHSVLGHALKKQNKLDEALIQYREAVRAEPENGSWHFWLAETLEAIKESDSALSEYREAVRLQPEDAFNHYRLAELLKKFGERESAAAEYREAVRLKPGEPYYQTKLSEITSQEPGVDKAIGKFQPVPQVPKQ